MRKILLLWMEEVAVPVQAGAHRDKDSRPTILGVQASHSNGVQHDRAGECTANRYRRGSAMTMWKGYSMAMRCGRHKGKLPVLLPPLFNY